MLRAIKADARGHPQQQAGSGRSALAKLEDVKTPPRQAGRTARRSHFPAQGRLAPNWKKNRGAKDPNSAPCCAGRTVASPPRGPGLLPGDPGAKWHLRGHRRSLLLAFRRPSRERRPRATIQIQRLYRAQNKFSYKALVQHHHVSDLFLNRLQKKKKLTEKIVFCFSFFIFFLIFNFFLLLRNIPEVQKLTL